MSENTDQEEISVLEEVIDEFAKRIGKVGTTLMGWGRQKIVADHRKARFDVMVSWGWITLFAVLFVFCLSKSTGVVDYNREVLVAQQEVYDLDETAWHFMTDEQQKIKVTSTDPEIIALIDRANKELKNEIPWGIAFVISCILLVMSIFGYFWELGIFYRRAVNVKYNQNFKALQDIVYKLG